MRRWKPSRRDVLRGFGTLAGASALGLWGCDPGNDPPDVQDPDDVQTPPGDEPQPGIVTRHDVMSPEGQSMLDAYRRAIEAMQALPASDPTSWRAQAQIHLDWCPHGNAYFLPWHRGYLHYFEQIIRAASEDPTFALPYWDWTTHPAIPPAFFEGVLNDPTRQRGPGDEVPAVFVGPDVIDDILGITDFQTFGSTYVDPSTCFPSPDGKEQRMSCGTGELEGRPHNNVHNWVGGDMRTFLSPLDPIFWLHHCNVDRLWAVWNVRNANGSDPTWRDFTFAGNFVDPAGDPQDVVVQSVFDTTALGYRYDLPAAGTESVAGASATTVVATASAANRETARAGRAIRVPVRITEEVRRALPGAPGLESGARRTVRLTVSGLEKPHDGALPVNVGIGSGGAGPDAPGHVGAFTFFPTGEGAHGGKATFVFDVTRELARADLSGSLDVHLEPVTERAAPEGGGMTLTPDEVRLEVLEPR
jgi:tyrosinase